MYLYTVTTDGMDAGLCGFSTWEYPGLGLEVPATQDMKVGFKKLELLGLPVGDKHMILSSLVLTHYQRVTDRQTDTQRHCAYS